MGLIPTQEHLAVLDPDLEAKRRRTWPGMAHFAGTGPAGRTCRECKLWSGCGEPLSHYARKGIHGGMVKPRACAQYRDLMQGEIGPSVPHEAAACKYWVENPTPPATHQR